MIRKLSAGLLAGLAATAAIAQVPPAAARDGVHTRAEVVQRVQTIFARLDLDRDGVISRAEFDQVRARRGQAAGGQGRGMAGGRLFALADRNGDGRVTVQEATAGALGHFDRADRNRDGVVTRDERLQARQQGGFQRRG